MVSYDSEPPLGGQGVVLRGMRRSLRGHGVEVDSITGRGHDAIRFPALLHRAPLDFSLHLWRHPQILEQPPADVVHAHGGPGGVLLLRGLRRPLVYTAHHTYAQAHPGLRVQRLISPFEARAYRHADRVLAVSASTADAVRRMGVPRDRVEVLPPGIDLIDVPDEDRDPARFLFAGRWETEKGVLDAIRVMGAVIARHPRASGVVVGRGRLDAAVHHAARERGAGRIQVLGAIDDLALRREYARAGVVVLPSRYEGLGLVALEAQACGAVVVGYDVDGLRESVGTNGVLVPRGAVASMATACLQLLDAPPLREQMAADAAARVRAEHSWRAVGERLLSVYAEVLAGDRRAGRA